MPTKPKARPVKVNKAPQKPSPKSKPSPKKAPAKLSFFKKNGTKKAAPPADTKKTPGKLSFFKKNGTKKAAPPPSRPAERLPQRSKPAPRPQLSLDRKLDILGTVLALAGLLTLLCLLSPIRSSVIEWLVSAINATFGFGTILFTAFLILEGGWLVLRKFDRIPRLTAARLVGVALLFLNLVIIFHILGMWATNQSSVELAQAGSGGGWTGSLILQGLEAILGTGGTGILLLAWLIIALILTLDRSIWDLVDWIGRMFIRFQDWLIEWFEERRVKQVTPKINPPVVLEDPEPQLIPPENAARPWALPNVWDILDKGENVVYNENLDIQRGQVIEEALVSLGAPAHIVAINRGPTITQFAVEPDFIETRGSRTGVRVSKIASLENDLALALSARTIRIQAPVPGKSYIGIEVPNDTISDVTLRDVIESEAFKRLKNPLRFALGENVSGNAVAADLSAMPHLLIAGQTGSGKSVCVNALICCLLIHNTPDDLQLLMVDPKRVELSNYNGIPHLLGPVVVELEKVVSALQWVAREMDLRYQKLAQAGCRNIQDYNNKQVARNGKKLTNMVVVIDELADLMMLAPDETEHTITRLAQLARATGIHLVIATQRPSVDVVTGLIKANLPARIAFAVASNVDSRVILDMPGAERLLGRGDMLFQAPDAPAPVRLQGVYVSDSEIQRLVSYWQSFGGGVDEAHLAASVASSNLPTGIPLKQMPLWDDFTPEEKADPLLDEAIDLSRRQGRASISMLQRRLRIGYTRAGRLIEIMEAKGIVGPPETGTGARQILDYGEAAPPVEEQGA